MLIANLVSILATSLLSLKASYCLHIISSSKSSTALVSWSRIFDALIINARTIKDPLSTKYGKKYPPIENKNGPNRRDRHPPSPAQAEHVLAYLSNSLVGSSWELTP